MQHVTRRRLENRHADAPHYARLRPRDPCPRILLTVFTVVQRRYRLGGLLDECVEAGVELAEVSEHQRLHLAELLLIFIT